MRFALFSDIHGNFTGTKAVLAAIEAIGGADMYIAAGDHIAGGSGGDDLLDLLSAHNVHLIQGDSDTEDKFVRLSQQAAQHPGSTRNPLTYYQEMLAWLNKNVSAENRERLAALPVEMSVKVASGQQLYVCHASPHATYDRICAPDVPLNALRHGYGGVDAEVIAYGHWHASYVRWLGDRLYINVASVGFRPDGLSWFTLLTHQDTRWVVEQKAVAYDVETEVQRIQSRGVPQPAP